MPTLGFLKKKRTKDSSGPVDPSSPITAEVPALGGGIAHSITSTSSNTLSSHSQAGSERGGGGGDIAHASQRPPSQGVSLQQAPVSADRSIGHVTASSQSPQQPALNSIINSQTDGASQPQEEKPRTGATMTPAQAAAHTATHSSGRHTVPTATVNHASNHASTVNQPQAMRQTKGKYTLGDFNFQRTLGTGSFGRVHLVQSKHNQRFYAVKVLKKAQVVKMKQVEHTNDERKMLQKVKQAFLVTLWGTFQDSKNLYMVMDFVEGGELFSLLRKSQVSRNHHSFFLIYFHVLGKYFAHSMKSGSPIQWPSFTQQRLH